MRSLLFFSGLLRPHVAQFALALLLLLATLAAGTALLGVSGWFLTGAALATGGMAFNLFGPSSAIRGLSLIRILARYGERLIGHDATLRLLSGLRADVFRRLFPRVALEAQGLRHGDLVSRLTADIDALDLVAVAALLPMLAALAIGAGLTAVFASLLPGATLAFALPFAAAALLVPLAIVAATRRAGRAVVAGTRNLRIAVLDAVDGHADLVASDAVGAARGAFAADADRLAAARRHLGFVRAAGAAALQALAALAVLGVLWQGLAAHAAGTLAAPFLAGLLLATFGAFEALGPVMRGVAGLGAATAAADRLKALVTRPEPVRDPACPAPLPEGARLALDGVGFGYDPDRPVLRDVSLDVEPGRRVAILGPSGGGKSTLLALILRLLDPQSGAVRIAGADLRTVPQADIHARVGLLGQRAPVFLGTIRENLLIAREAASDQELWQALERARLADLVRALPEGLDTFVGETGKTLSAGQGRRLCLARILLSRAPILVLDEPTAGLDAETERDFLADLAAATDGRTLLVATHAALPPGAVDETWRLVDGRLEPLPQGGV